MIATDFLPAVDVVLKVTLLLAAAALASRALARGSAAARHQIWVLAILASLLMPVLTVVAPRWTIAVLPASKQLDDPAVTPRPNAVAPAQVTNISDDVAAPVSAPGLIPSPAEPVTISPISIAASIWLAGALLVLARVAFGTGRVWWIARRAEPAPGWAPLGNQLARSLGIDRHVTFVSGDADAMPMACGILRARVLLPSEADDWSPARLRVVLLHELAHVKRRDCLTQVVAHLACAAYWFNPMVWIAARRLRAEREHACDDLVLAAGTRGSDYADHLLDIARSLRSGAWPTWSAVTMAHRSQLEGRLMAILDPALPRRSPTRRSVATVAALAVIGAISLAGARPVAKTAVVAFDAPAAAPAAAAVAASPTSDDEQGRPSSPSSPTPTPAPAPTPAPLVMPRPTPAPTPAPLISIGPLPLPNIDIDIDADAIAHTVNDAVGVVFGQQGQQRPQPAPRVVIGNRSNREPADPKVVSALTDALKDENKQVRQQALHSLVSMRASIPPETYTALLKDADPEVRQQAVVGLGQMRDPKYLDPLMVALKDQNPDVRQQAAFAVGQIRDPRAIDALSIALKDTTPEVRRQAAFALGQLRDRRAIDPLIAALKDSNPEVRQQAAFALGQIR